MSSNLYKVFVYGTLKKGEPNHSWFSKATGGYFKFLCNAQTTEKYPLIISTKYNIPFLLYKPGTGHYVKGELYEVDEKVLENLDILEDHPNFYIREKYNISSMTEEGQTIEAWIYFIKNFNLKLLNKPMFENYKSNGDHGLKYVTRYERDDSNYNHKLEIIHFSEESTIEDLNETI